MQVNLLEKSLWKEFDAQCNEMIITKIGRNLFPILEYSFKGLNEFQNYQIGISMIPIGNKKLKFVGGLWEALETMEEVLMPNEVLMPKCKSGRELMSRGLKLEKLKLTNTKEGLLKSDQMIRVQSMRQYIPQLTVYEMFGIGESRIIGKFQFNETKFIAVTAYQSDSVKHLKVQRNKFAQGFREGSRATTKRPQSTSSSTSPSSTSTSSESPDVTNAKRSNNGDVTSSATGYNQFNDTPLMTHFPNVPNFDPNWANYYSGQHFQNAEYWNYSNHFGYQWNG